MSCRLAKYLCIFLWVSVAIPKRIASRISSSVSQSVKRHIEDVSLNSSNALVFQGEDAKGFVHDDFEALQLEPESTLPKWVNSLRNFILRAISRIGSYFVKQHHIKTPWVNFKIEKFHVNRVHAYEFKYRRKEKEIRVDINDLLLDARVYLREFKLLKFIPTLLNRVVGDAFVDLKVQGGIRSGFHKHQDGKWSPSCEIDSKGVGVPPKLRVWANLHINKALNWVDKVVVPAILPLLKGKVSGEVRKALRAFAGENPRVFQIHDRFRMVQSWWRGHSDENGTIREGEECFNKDHCKAGPCSYCGTGFCCRAGNFAGGCDGSGDEKHHVCVPAPKYRFSLGAENLGEECWNAHKCRDGKCKVCGRGLCCRKGRAREGCDGIVGGIGRHECVVDPSVEIAQVHVEEEFQDANEGEDHIWSAFNFTAEDDEFVDAREEFDVEDEPFDVDDLSEKLT